jgi:hypothetical protein
MPWKNAKPYLVPVPAGQAYRIDSPPWNALVTRELAQELSRVLEVFAREAGFTPERPVEIHFEPGIVGHHQVGRAADIYQVNRRRLDLWKADWDRAQQDPQALLEQRRRNLGWRLYKALANHGDWARPDGYPVQLFGPWTREEGPWKRISDALLRAHRDHVHVAK